MLEMMAANAVIPEQKKRSASSCANITKYFSPQPPATVKVAESLPNAANSDAIPEYFKRSCGPLDLSQPGHVYSRPPMHDTAGSSGGGHPMDLPTPKWPQMRDDHGCGENMVGVSMERIERQIFQELDSRMCHELDESKETDDEEDDEEDEDSEGQEMYENSLSMKYNREMKQRSYDPHHAMYAMADAMKPEAIMVDKGGGPGIANAFNMMLSNSRAAALGPGGPRNDVVSRVDKPSCGDCLYSEPPPHAYKWVPDLNPPVDNYKMPVNEVKDPHPPLEAFIASAEQQQQIPPNVSTPLMSAVTSAATKSIVSTAAAAGVPSASGYPSSREISLPPHPRPPADEQSVEVISYEDFLKSEGMVSKEKQPDEPPPPPPPPPPPVEAVVKKQSNIRRFFTRVPRTVEVKFDHKRLVTVTAVVHPQPQSPHKLPLKKTNARKHSPRRATKKQLSDTHGNAGKQGYNTRRHKSNVVVDTEEIDLTIKEMNADVVMAEEGPKAWRPIRRRLRGSGNVGNEEKLAPDAGCQKNGIADDSSFTFRTGKNLNKSSYKFTGKQKPPPVQTRDLPPRSVRPKRFQLREGSSDEEDHERPVGRSISYTFPKRTLRPRYETMPTTTISTETTTTTTTTTTTNMSCRKSARLNPKAQEPKLDPNPYAIDINDDAASSSHQPLKSIYTTTVVQPDASNSLRLKFTRIGKKHHHHRRHHHHHHHPYQRRHKKHKSAKVQKAMQLLQRAKESSIMRDPRQDEDDDVEDEDTEGLRRSSRRSSVVVRKAMEGAARAEEMRQARITAQRQTPPRRTKQLRLRQQIKGRSENRPGPGRPQTRSGNPVNRGSVVSGFSSTRGPVKLASIFTKRVPAPAKRTSPAKRAKPVVDAAAAKARQDFLNSSIPESLQQKLNRSQVLAQQLEEDYSPFPHTSHIQQLSEDEQRKLKEEAKAPLKLKMLTGKKEEYSLPLKSKPEDKLHLGSLTSISGKVSECYKSQIYQMASFNSSLKPLPPIVIRQSLADIALRFPKFPAIKLFRRYKNKRKRMEELEETMWADQEKESLSVKRPAEVIEIDGEEENNCEKRQKTGENTDTSLRHSPTDQKETKEKVPDKTEIKPNSQGSGQQGRSSWLWTDKYQPTHSADVIGNSKPVGHLRQWLLEWRERCRWAAKHGLDGCKTGRKGYRKGSWSEEEDSDFIISGGEDDSSSDGSRLCNTMLLTGPSGVGKTAAVYALAEELGFKVLEVNASSRRMGKQVLTQLQEATQSHQIVAKGKPAKPFFQTPAAKKEHKDKIAWNEAVNCNSSLAEEKGTASVSLVLFEDLDLVFDDDDGFCQAVNTFMSTTKRPIILTSSVDNVFVTSKIKGHFEELKFRVPNTSVTASYLQVLCLAENLQTDFKDVLSLVEHNRGDVRQTLLSLQYWACSGGDALAREEANSLPPATSDTVEKQDEDKPERKASVIVENVCEDSMGNDLFETLRNADLPQDEANSTEAMQLDETSAPDTLPQRLPYAHTGCLESIRALRVFPHRSLCHALQASDLKTMAGLVEQCHQLQINLTLSNLPHLLLLPTNPSSASMTHKGPSLNIVWHVEEEPPIAETRVELSGADKGPPTVSKPKLAKTPFEREAVPQALASLSRLHDNLSVLDSTFGHVMGESHEESSSCWKWWYREPQDGLFDDPSTAEEEALLPHLRETGAFIEAATLRTCSRSLQEVMGREDFESRKECFTLPIVHQFLCRDNGMEPSACRQRKLDNETVCDHLTSVMQVNRHKLTSDYLPYVRAICAAEKLRQTTNRKRGGRFLHYLDTMALPSSVLGRLSEEFP